MLTCSEVKSYEVKRVQHVEASIYRHPELVSGSVSQVYFLKIIQHEQVHQNHYRVFPKK